MSAALWFLWLRVSGPAGREAGGTTGYDEPSAEVGDTLDAGATPGPESIPLEADGVEVPRRGGRLRLAGADPTTLDPALVRDVVSAEYIYEIFSGLVTLSPELEVIGDLATSWEVAPDGMIYTFTVRSDAVFHDGTPVDAGAAAYAIERACDPATGSAVAETYLGDIVGCRDKLAGKARTVAGLAVPDDHRLAVTIDAPKAYFLSKLTYPVSFVVDRSQVERGPDWTRRPNGTGPFRLTAYVHQEKLVLEPHEQYYGGAAYLDAVEYDLRPVTAVTLYENGELDAVPVGLGDLARVRDPLNPLSGEVVQGPGDLGLNYLAFNTRRPPFDDVHVRRAFNLALDKQRLSEVVLQGAVEPAYWILPPGMPGHDPGASRWRYDPERAIAELAASRYGVAEALPPITLNSSGAGGGNVPAEAVADMLGETLGIEIAVEQAPWETFQEEVAAGSYDCYMLGWSADYPDPQDFLDVLFHSRSPLNYTGYANPEADRLIEAARTERVHARRLDLYGRAERLILADGPWLPLYSGVDTWLVAPYVHGFSMPPVVVPRLAKVWLGGEVD